MIAYHIRITGYADRKATKCLPTIRIPTAKIMQGERRTKRKLCFLLFIPSRSLSWAKPK